MQDATTVFGIDFTSVPSARKPIMCLRATLNGLALTFEELVHLHDFDAFEAFLATPGPWTAGMDLPFGQARRLVENLDRLEGWISDPALRARQDRG